MREFSIKRRFVFQLSGYDPKPPEAVYRRFVRELRRFETTWKVTARATEAEVTPDEARWTVVASGPNWGTETAYRVVRWEDVITDDSRRSDWRRLPAGLLAFADFFVSGAFWGYLRTNWRYAGFFLYPYVLLTALGALALIGGAAVARFAGSALVGMVAAGALYIALLQWPARRLFMQDLLDDWIFARNYVRGEHSVLGPRLERVAKSLCEAARAGEADEILLVGHSLGAALAIDLLDRALLIDPKLGEGRTRVSFLSVGSSVPKIALHRAATRFRAAIERVANAPAIFWGDYQALTDVMNFYKVDPVVDMGITGKSPLIRQVRVKAMLDSAAYRRVKRNFYRVHCQFVSGNDRRAAYDYYMFTCGPFYAEDQARLPEGVVTSIGPDGALANPPLAERAEQAGDR
jgi:hypothetical protein